MVLGFGRGDGFRARDGCLKAGDLGGVVVLGVLKCLLVDVELGELTPIKVEAAFDILLVFLQIQVKLNL